MHAHPTGQKSSDSSSNTDDSIMCTLGPIKSLHTPVCRCLPPIWFLWALWKAIWVGVVSSSFTETHFSWVHWTKRLRERRDTVSFHEAISHFYETVTWVSLRGRKDVSHCPRRDWKEGWSLAGLNPCTAILCGTSGDFSQNLPGFSVSLSVKLGSSLTASPSICLHLVNV